MTTLMTKNLTFEQLCHAAGLQKGRHSQSSQFLAEILLQGYSDGAMFTNVRSLHVLRVRMNQGLKTKGLKICHTYRLQEIGNKKPKSD